MNELIDYPITPEIPAERFDAVIVLGKNLGLNWGPKEIREQRFNLIPHSRVSVLAAGILYKEGLTDKIIFSTGKTAGDEIESEAALMKKHLLRIFPSIPESAVEVEEVSWDTNTNAKVIKKIIDKNKFKFRKVVLMTTDFHLDRALYLFARAGVDLDDLFASDEVLKQSRPSFVGQYQSSELYAQEEERERKGLKGLRVQRMPLAPEVLSILTGIMVRKVGAKRLITGLTPLNLS